MSYHELEAEVMRVRGLLAAAIEDSAKHKADAERAWSKLNWKQRECDGLREKIVALETQVSGSAVLPLSQVGSSNSIDALLASIPVQFETLPHEWRAVNVSVEQRGPRFRLGKRFDLSLRVSDGSVAVNIEASGLVRSEALATDAAKG